VDKTIFVIDDIRANLVAAEQTLDEHYNVITALSGIRALELLDKRKPDLILLDIEMPEMNGFELLTILKAKPRSKDIPVIMLTGISDVATEAKGFELGAADFIIKPFSAPVLLNRVKLQLNISEKLTRRTDELMETFRNRIFILTDVMEKRNGLASGGRTERTAKFVKIMLVQMLKDRVYYDEIKDWNVEDIASSSMLHNIGKVSITDTILSKPPDELTPEERVLLRTHPAMGESIINQVIGHDGENQFLSHAKTFAKYHHEQWDGKGYPGGIAGTDIPLEGRIMALVDVFDNTFAHSGIADSHEACVFAGEAILNGCGTKFDPTLVEVFETIRDQFEAICTQDL